MEKTKTLFFQFAETLGGHEASDNDDDDNVFCDLATWIEKALRAAMQENSSHLKSIQSAKSLIVSDAGESQYRKAPVTGRVSALDVF